MTVLLPMEEAVSLLKKAVKYSNVKGQKHIDLSLVNADDLQLYERAMVTVQTAVSKGELTREQLNLKLGLD